MWHFSEHTEDDGGGQIFLVLFDYDDMGDDYSNG